MKISLRTSLVFAYDLLSLAVAWFGGIYIRFNLIWPDYYTDLAITSFLFILGAHVVACYSAGLYRGIWLFASIHDLKRVIKAVFFTSLGLLFLLAFERNPSIAIPRSMIVLLPLLLLTMMGGGRLLWRVIKEHRLYGSYKTSGSPIVIVGASSTSAALLRELERSPDWRVVAIVDDDKEKWGLELHGFTVVGSVTELPKILQEYKCKHVILALPTSELPTISRATELATASGAQTFTVPGLNDLMSGRLALTSMRPIEIEDLLGRNSTTPDQSLMGKCITGKNILVTGAGGSIGSELCRQIVKFSPKKVLLLELSEYALYLIEGELNKFCTSNNLNVEILPILGSAGDKFKVESLLNKAEIHTIYHAAAYKHVPLVEHNPIAGIQNNVIGTLNIATAAKASNVETFVLVSTDKAVRPTNIMGATKRLAELVLQALAKDCQNTRFCMVRFGNVLGSSGSVVPLFKKQISAGGPITLTHRDITRYFMTIPEASQLVIQAGSMGMGGEVFVLDMGEPIRIYDLATRMIQLAGYELRTQENPAGDIEIQTVGLRPGEKLYEELLIGDDTAETSHPQIMRAFEHEIPWSELEPKLNRLSEACTCLDTIAAIALLRELVSEYAPNSSLDVLTWKKLAAI